MADSFGHPRVWYFFSEPDMDASSMAVLPAGSVLAKWRLSADPAEKKRLAGELQSLLSGVGSAVAKDGPDSMFVSAD
jgi:hypothetical protein